MTPEDAARASAEAVGGISSLFMLAPSTYARGAELGFDGMDFYVAGRGAALGEVDADVVAAAFVFFHPPTVRRMWEASASVMSRRDAAAAWAAACHDWAREHVPADVDAARLAALAGQVVEAASPAGAPLFAGWRALEEPPADDASALAVHRMNGLRELRAALHGAAVLAAGLTPLEAVLVRTPYMAGIFGWPEPYPDVAGVAEAWASAEAATDAMMGRVLGVLTPAELEEFVALSSALHGVLSG
jgi:hypothetical protein